MNWLIDVTKVTTFAGCMGSSPSSCFSDAAAML
jgi:hypothetical protein